MNQIGRNRQKMIKLHNDYKNLSAIAQGTVLAIGNFDGLHLGHRAVIDEASEIAARLKAPLAVMTFEPHPREFFQKESEPFRLTLLPAKQRLLQGWGVDHLFALPFDEKFSQLDGNGFVQRILVEGLKVRHVVVGDDFAFGHKRSGTVETLKSCDSFGLSVINPVCCNNQRVYSSTRIREHLKKAEFDAAAHLLGTPWQMESEVIHGDKRGRELGFPTANQQVSRYIRMPFGIYAVNVMIEGQDSVLQGAANFGIRPMFRIKEPLLETYIFDFDFDIYGKIMRVEPVRLLRGEMTFDGIEALQERMKQDCLEARAVLKSTKL